MVLHGQADTTILAQYVHTHRIEQEHRRARVIMQIQDIAARTEITATGRDVYKRQHMIDEGWKEHLREMDELRHSVQNASYENKDPLLIYKLESVSYTHLDVYKRQLLCL